MSRRWFWAVFIGIVVLAGVLRLWQLGQVPVSVYWDEAAMMVDIKSILGTGLDAHGRPWYQLIYPSYGDYKLPVYIWAATASSAVFGLSQFSLRLPSALAGILTVIVAGALARVLLKIGTRTKYSIKTLQSIQLSVMAVVAVSPWSITFSRTGFEGHIGQLLLATSLFLAGWGLLHHKKWVFFLSPVIGALATYSYYSVRFVWVAVFVGLCVLAVIEKWQHLPLKKILLNSKALIFLRVSALILFGVLLIPLLRSPLAKDADKFRLGTTSILNNEELAIESNYYRQLAGNTPIDRVFYHRWWLLARELLKNYSDNLSPSFLFLSGDPNFRHGTGQFGLFLAVFAPVFVVGLVVLLKRHTFLGLFLIGWWLVALLPASVPENTPHALRSLNALVPLSIIIGFGLSWIWTRLPHVVFKAGLAVLITFFVSQFWWFYLSVYPKLSANDWQSGFASLAQEISQQVAQDKTVYINPFDDRFYLWLMIYGPYTGKDFQAWKTADYKFVATTLPSNFKNIEFQWPSEEELSKRVNEGGKIVVAGNFKDISELCQKTELFSCEAQTVQDEVGFDKFIVAELAKPKQ